MSITKSGKMRAPDGMRAWRVSIALPGVSGEKHKHGENFQAASQHGPAQNQLAQIAESAKIAGGANSLQSGTDVVEGTKHR